MRATCPPCTPRAQLSAIYACAHTVVCLAIAIYTTTWTCDNILVPEIELDDHFNFNYGFGFAITGYVASLLIFNVSLFFLSSADTEVVSPDMPSPKEKVGITGRISTNMLKAFVGVSIGLIIGTVSGVVVGAANDAFESDPAPDPNVNPCAYKKPYHANFHGLPSTTNLGDNYFDNTACVVDGLVAVLEQAGANVTEGFYGEMNAGSRRPITSPYDQTDLCPVNVHWHLGAEHLSIGPNGYDCESGCGPAYNVTHGYHGEDRRQLASTSDEYERQGFRCRHYDHSDAKFTTEYAWEHCKDMQVGETYEVHWPHSAAGACGTKWQYQYPFYDGVFCNDGIIHMLTPLNTYQKIGVQAQVFTIVNDDAYDYDDDKCRPLLDGMVTDGACLNDQDMGVDMTIYTGSTTGTTRNNVQCSRYAPITWQVRLG